MKKLFFATLLLLSFSIVNAQSIEEKIIETGSYTNSQGVTINLENYNKMKDIMNENEIDSLTNHLYDKIKESEKIDAFENKIIETVYMKVQNDIFILENNELTLEEYEEKQNLPQARGNFHQTSSKQITLLVTAVNNIERKLSLQNVWLTIPENKSFDVIALRWQSTAGGVILEEYNGRQEYKDFQQQVNPSYINYEQTSGNFKTTLYGVGLSQNLVNGSYYYVNLLYAKISCTGTVNIYGTYQHAKGTLTLSESQNYSFASGGYGNVLKFGSPGSSLYDKMGGVDHTTVCN